MENKYYLSVFYAALFYGILYSRIENTMDLRPQDVVLALKLLVHDSKPWSYSKLGEELGMSASHAFQSVLRAEAAQLLNPSKLSSSPTRRSRGMIPQPNRHNLKEFLVHGVRYAFPVERGGPTRGIPTAEGAPPLNQHFHAPPLVSPVWPYAEGSARGAGFSPLSKNVPQAALRDPKLYELLALVDAIREGRAREREIAIRELTARIDAK
jgi:hypothetical protein